MARFVVEYPHEFSERGITIVDDLIKKFFNTFPLKETTNEELLVRITTPDARLTTGGMGGMLGHANDPDAPFLKYKNANTLPSGEYDHIVEIENPTTSGAGYIWSGREAIAIDTLMYLAVQLNSWRFLLDGDLWFDDISATCKTVHWRGVDIDVETIDRTKPLPWSVAAEEGIAKFIAEYLAECVEKNKVLLFHDQKDQQAVTLVAYMARQKALHVRDEDVWDEVPENLKKTVATLLAMEDETTSTPTKRVLN